MYWYCYLTYKDCIIVIIFLKIYDSHEISCVLPKNFNWKYSQARYSCTCTSILGTQHSPGAYIRRSTFGANHGKPPASICECFYAGDFRTARKRDRYLIERRRRSDANQDQRYSLSWATTPQLINWIVMLCPLKKSVTHERPSNPHPRRHYRQLVTTIYK